MSLTNDFTRDLVTRVHRAQELSYLYEAAFDVTSAGFILAQANGVVRRMNQAAEAIFGRSAHELVGQGTLFHLLETALVNEGDRPDGMRINRLLIKDGTVRKQRVLINRDDNTQLPALLTVNRISVPNTEGDGPAQLTLGFVAVIEDNSEVENLTVTDALTGLFNRRYFDRKLAEEYERMRRARSDDTGRLSLLFLDVDKFHDFNEVHGHPDGDLALQTVGQVLKEGVRYIDSACRYGGEEFAVILPATDLDGAACLAKRLCERVAAVRFGDNALSVTASIGISCHTSGDGGSGELVREADEAMYEAKKQGRNRVVRHVRPARSPVAP